MSTTPNEKTMTSVNNTLYIPPEGLYFRLLGYKSQQCLVSRRSPDPTFFQVSVNYTIYNDQYFSLLHGTGSRTGLYAIKGRASNFVLFSRVRPDPRVGHVAGNAKYDDNWFELFPGTGDFQGCFRLITPSENMVMYSRTNPEPCLYNIDAKSEYPDQWFTYVWEDMQVDSIVYNLNEGQIASSTPLAIAEQTLSNHTDVDQQMSFAFSASVTNESSFTYETGFTVTAGMEFSVGIPFISENKFKVEASTTNTWTWGQTTSYTTAYNATFPVVCGPNKVIRATASVTQGKLDVPYTLHLSSKSSGVKVTTTGIWRGVSSWNLHYTVKLVGKAIEE